MVEKTPDAHKNEANQNIPQSAVPTDIGKVAVNKSQDERTESDGVTKKREEVVGNSWMGRRILQKLQEWWRVVGRPENSNRLIALATLVIALATAVSTYEIVTGSNDTKQIVTAAQNIQTALDTQNQQSQAALYKTLRENRRALRRNLHQSQEAMDASNAQGQAALEATIAQSRLDQRAFVNFGKTMEDNPVITPEHPDIQVWEFRPYIGNSGDTPTRNAQVYANFLPLPTPLPANFSFPDLDTTTPNTRFVLGPKENATGPLLSIPIALLQGVKDRTVHLYFYGWLTYQDVFQKTPPHMSMFCIELNDVRGQMVQGTGYQFAWTLCQHHNCADDECKGEPYGNAKTWQ
jgi:hypothetical protein